MSVDYSANVVYGVRVPRHVVEPFVKQRIDDHKHPVPSDASFCPVCGEPVVIVDRDFPFEDDDILSVYRADYADEDSCILGCSVACVDDERYASAHVISTESLRDKVIQRLQQAELMNDTLGLYLVFISDY